MSDTVINADWLKKIKNAVDTFCDQAAKTKILSQITIVEQNLSEYKNVRQVCSNYFSTKIQENALEKRISIIFYTCNWPIMLF